MEISRRDAIACAVGAVTGGVLVALIQSRCCRRRAGDNAAAAAAEPSKMKATYETSAAVAQYLQFHYSPPAAYYLRDPKMEIGSAFGFPIRIAELCTVFRPAQTRRALDIGCAVGVSSFVLSGVFDKVVGVDLSEAFIAAANEMKTKGSMAFEVPVQGLITEHRIAKLGDAFPGDKVFHPERVEFVVGDAEALKLGTFDFVLAANLLCRVPHPRRCIEALASYVSPGGVLVLLPPFRWTEESTNRDEWIGGAPATGRSEGPFKALVEKAGFELLNEGEEPHLIPDHCRRYQLGWPMRTVWRRK